MIAVDFIMYKFYLTLYFFTLISLGIYRTNRLRKMVKRSRAAILPTNIILLQNLVKRDPESYYEEFLQQYAHYESLRDIFMLGNMAGEGDATTSGVESTTGSSEGNTSTSQLIELIGFVSQVCSCFLRKRRTSQMN